MDDSRRRGCDFAVGVDMRHDVMAEFFLLFGGIVEVDVGDMGFEIGDLLCGDGQTELALGARQLYPEPAPCLDTGLRREQRGHIL